MAATIPTMLVSRAEKIGIRENPRSWTSAIASAGVALAGSFTTSTSGTMTSRTVVSPRSRIL